MSASPLNGGALAAAVRSGLLVTDGAAAARRLEQGWSFVAIGSDSTLLAAAVRAEFGRARTTLTEAGIPR
jgi:4-hydroxy-2-oxoheptanedioate aldolase